MKAILYSLTLMFTVAATSPCLAEGKATLWTVGDSTMAPNANVEADPGDPGRGWVEGLTPYLNPDKITMRNVAVSGRSTKSYIDEGRWQKVVDQVKPGDFVLIQFGHNDAKQSDAKRYTDPETTYKDNLRLMVAQVREKGATPVILTSIVRRYFNADGTMRDSHGRYVPAAREVAAELKVDLIDMNTVSGAIVEKCGPEESKKLYLHVAPGVAERFPDGNRDDTHLALPGAEAFSAGFAAAVIEAGIPLAAFLSATPIK